MADLSQHLQLRQQQRLVMTPQLKQALKILQLNTVELESLIQTEMAENPMLEELGSADAVPEEVDPEGEAPAEGEPKAEPQSDVPVDEATREAARDAAEATQELSLDKDQPHELDDWAQYFDDDGTDYSLARAERESGEEKEKFETFLASPETLQEHLLAQLESDNMEDERRRLCEEVVGRVDERGYFEGSLLDLAREAVTVEAEAFAALRKVQSLDPPGVAARDLRECLLLQLEAQGRRGSAAWRAVEEHFDDVTHRRWAQLALSLRIDPSEAEAAAHVVASLEPFPGRPYGGSPNAGVRVDASLEKDPLSGAWKVLINDGGLPRLGFNAYYRKLMRPGGDAASDPEAKAWLKEKHQAAVWLLRGIEQRHRTLRRVLEEIVAVQEGFLDHGPAAFQPLTLKDIAERTGLHESTISRVTTGKYVQSPRGVFELKYFFTSALRTEEGGETSSRAVKDRLKDLIHEEDPANPLSDQHLAEQMSQEGVKIARRTVAKYREELHFPPAHLRRRA